VAKSPVQERTRARRLFLLALLLFFLYLTFLLFRPYLGAVIFSVMLTSTSYPIYRRLLQWNKGRKNRAAFLAATLLVVVVVVPLVGFSAAVIQQGVESVGQVSEWLKAGNLEEVLSSPWLQPFRQKAGWLMTRLGLVDRPDGRAPVSIIGPYRNRRAGELELTGFFTGPDRSQAP